MPDMSLYNLIHQAVDGAPGCGDECRMSTHSCSESSAFNREIDRLISAAGFFASASWIQAIYLVRRCSLSHIMDALNAERLG
jgi:hypothetical protein